jgi:glucuronosyltransferase
MCVTLLSLIFFYTLFTDEMNTLFDVTEMSTLTMLHDLYTMGITITNFTVSHPKMKAFIQSDQKFDVILLDIFLDEALLGLGHQFNAPIVGVSTLGACKWTTDLIGSPSPLSYVPHPLLR